MGHPIFSSFWRKPESSEARQREKLSQQGMEVELMAPDKFANVLKNDVARWGKIIRDAGIKSE